MRHETRTLERELKRGRGDYLRLTVDHDALQRSLYSTQLAAVLDSFERSQVLILQTERCIEDTVGQLQRTFQFLGLDPDLRRTPATSWATRSAPLSSAPKHVVERYRSMLAADADRLVAMAPEIDLRLWPSCADSVGAGPLSPA